MGEHNIALALIHRRLHTVHNWPRAMTIVGHGVTKSHPRDPRTWPSRWHGALHGIALCHLLRVVRADESRPYGLYETRPT